MGSPAAGRADYSVSYARQAGGFSARSARHLEAAAEEIVLLELPDRRVAADAGVGARDRHGHHERRAEVELELALSDRERQAGGLERLEQRSPTRSSEALAAASSFSPGTSGASCARRATSAFCLSSRRS